MEDFELFKGKTLSNLFEDIYINQVNKKIKISSYIDEIRDYIKRPGDIAIIGPLIKDLVDTSVRNDEQLIKLATIAQRIMNATAKSEGDAGFLTEAEKKQLLTQLDEFKVEIDTEVQAAEKKLNKLKK